MTIRFIYNTTKDARQIYSAVNQGPASGKITLNRPRYRRTAKRKRAFKSRQEKANETLDLRPQRPRLAVDLIRKRFSLKSVSP